MMNFFCAEKHDKKNRFDSDWGSRQNKIKHTKQTKHTTRAKPQNLATLNTAKVTLITRKLRQGIRQPEAAKLGR